MYKKYKWRYITQTDNTYWRWVANPQRHFPPFFAHFRLVPTLRMHGYCNFTWLTSCFNLCSAHRFSAIRLPRLDMRFFYLHFITIWNTRGVLYLPGRTSVYKPDPKVRRACETGGSRFDPPHYTRAGIRSLDHTILSGWWRHDYLKRCTLRTEPLSLTHSPLRLNSPIFNEILNENS